MTNDTISASRIPPRDGNGLRVQKVSGGNTTVTIFSGGQDIAEYTNTLTPTSPSSEYIYAGSTQIMSVQSGTTHYLHDDHLSLRFRTDTSGNITDPRGTYPFGEAWYTPSGAPWMYTSYFRDTESGVDRFAIAHKIDYARVSGFVLANPEQKKARSYVNRLARFSSPDSASANYSDPQSLNRYGYTLNDPINNSDPLGLTTCDPNGQNCHDSVTVSADGDGGGPDLDVLLRGSGGAGQDIPPPPLIFRGAAIPGASGWAQGMSLAGPSPQPPPPPGYEQCIMEALQEVIATAEGTVGALNNGYGLLVYGSVTSAPGAYQALAGQTFTAQTPYNILNPETLTGHPDIFVGNTSAFGRYQITARTARNYNFTDFSPRGQDAAAEVLFNARRMVVPAMQGNLGLALRRGNTEWTSLPGGSQERMSLAGAVGVFQNAMLSLPDCQ